MLAWIAGAWLAGASVSQMFHECLKSGVQISLKRLQSPCRPGWPR